MSRDKLTPAQESLMRMINNPDVAKVIGATLAEIAVELMDAKQEAAHWKASFETLRAEIKILAAVVMRQQGVQRLVITRAELAAVPPDTELVLETPEPGVRIYTLQARNRATDAAVRNILAKPN